MICIRVNFYFPLKGILKTTRNLASNAFKYTRRADG